VQILFQRAQRYPSPLDKQRVHDRRHDNASVDVDNPEAIRKAVESSIAFLKSLR
jgi:hypothetical protein